MSLPFPPSSFVGRTRELRAIQLLLTETRLLTLTGPGGTGKTRLALEAAHRLVGRFASGMTFVAFESIAEPILVPQMVAAALAVPEQRGGARLAALIECLRDQQHLLVFDNCEHLIQAAASLAAALLGACPGLHILATSREPLGIVGEQVFSVPPLTLPDSIDSLSLADVKRFEAVELFVARAHAANPTFVLNRQNATVIVTICRHLDGMPLAIELAAARTRTITVEQIAARLDDRFRLLVMGSRVAPPRHQTLRAVLDWSYDLLPEPERQLFERLGVFAGGCTLAAAEDVCSTTHIPRDRVLDTLAHIADKSLLVVQASKNEARYRMLETIRQYAIEKLAERGTLAEVRDRHLNYFLQFAEHAEPELQGPNQVAWFDRIEHELGNLRAATEWSMTPGPRLHERVSAGLRVVVALLSFWDSHGYPSEGIDRLNRLLAQAERSGLADLSCARALHALGALYWGRGRYSEAQPQLERALELGRALNDRETIAHASRTLGSVRIGQGDVDGGMLLLEQSIDIWRTLAIAGEYGLAWALTALGGAALLRGEYTRARDCLEEANHLFELSDNKNYLAYVRRRLSQVAVHQGDLDRATALCKESLRLNLLVSSQRGIAASLATLAGIARARGDPLVAARLLGVSIALLDELGERLTPVDGAELEANRAGIRTELGAARFETAVDAGRREPLDSVVAEALAFTRHGPIGPARTPRQREKIKYGGLTARDRTVAALIAQGKSNREIADTLVIGIKAVEAHVGRMLNKLGFTSRAQIAAWAVDKGLAAPPQAMTE